MSTIQSLLVLLDAAQKDRDDARSQLEAARRAHDAARQQAQSLTDWRKDYQTRWSAQFSRSGGMEIMRCYQDFTARLGDAVTEQDKRVEQARLNFEQRRSLLLECERKVAAVEQLIKRREQELLRKQAQQEQKTTDEQAARAGRGGSLMKFGASRFAPTSF